MEKTCSNDKQFEPCTLYLIIQHLSVGNNDVKCEQFVSVSDSGVIESAISIIR